VDVIAVALFICAGLPNECDIDDVKKASTRFLLDFLDINFMYIILRYSG
jgi:hypothetical protein